MRCLHHVIQPNFLSDSNITVCSDLSRLSDQPAVLTDHRKDQQAQRFVKSASLIRDIHGLRLLSEAEPDLRSAANQESRVPGILHILLTPEQGQLIAVRPSRIRAEHRAVSALIAHSVHVKDLFLLQSRNPDRDVRAVRADVRTDLADRRAAKAPLLGQLTSLGKNALYGLDSLEEVIFATAVAGDLRDKCFQLEVAWRGESAAKAHQDRVEECEFETQIGSFFYGEHIFKATQAGSIYNSWQEVLVAIFDAGCSNIANEVANTKMGLAYTGEDPNYIESPYSKKSFVDFYDNVMSIKNSLYGGINLSTPAKKSAMDLLKTYNSPLAGSMEAAISGALAALQNCQAGTAFVDDPRAAKVKAAMDAINHLDEQLAAAATWASTIK